MGTLFAVVDCARDRRIYDLVHDALFPMCLFRTEVVSPMGRNAPYLVPVEHAERLIESWRKVGGGESWGILLRSSQAQAHVRQRLRTFNQAKLPDGRVVLFRWWDPRVFRVYLPTCDTDDLSQWFASVEEYICETEDGAGFTIYRNGDEGLIQRRVEGWSGF
jgi:hypothetical protein